MRPWVRIPTEQIIYTQIPWRSESAIQVISDCTCKLLACDRKGENKTKRGYGRPIGINILFSSKTGLRVAKTVFIKHYFVAFFKSCTITISNCSILLWNQFRLELSVTLTILQYYPNVTLTLHQYDPNVMQTIHQYDPNMTLTIHQCDESGKST